MTVVIAEKQEAVLGLRVFTAMHRHGWTIPKLAKAAHVPLSTVQKICKGEGKQPSLWTIWALARALGVTIDYLAGDTETPACPVCGAGGGVGHAEDDLVDLPGRECRDADGHP